MGPSITKPPQIISRKEYEDITLSDSSDHYNAEYYEEVDGGYQNQNQFAIQRTKPKNKAEEDGWKRMDVFVNREELASSFSDPNKNRNNNNNYNHPYNKNNNNHYTNSMDHIAHTTMQTPPPGQNSTGPNVIIRGEEVGIVLVVLILWVGAIILFFNRWGKIRMLEPYQPKFCEHHNPNCPMADPLPPIAGAYPRTFSKYNLANELQTGSPHFSKCNYHGIPANSITTAAVEPLLSSSHHHGFFPAGMSHSLGVPQGSSMTYLGSGVSPRLGHRNRPRQNSVFVTSPNYSPSISLFGGGQILKNTSRRTKSAVDLSTIVLCGEFMDNVRRNSKNSITNL